MKKYVILFYAVLFLMISVGLQSQTMSDDELRELLQKSVTAVEESMKRGKSLCDYLENGRFVSSDGNISMQFFSKENAGYLLFGRFDDSEKMHTEFFLVLLGKVFKEGSAKIYSGGLTPVDNNLNVSGVPTLSDFIVYSPRKFGWIFKDINSDNNGSPKIKSYSEIIFVRHEDAVYADECISGDCQNGQGAKKYDNGTMYVGQWKDGKMNGQGTFTSPDGLEYVGQWKVGLMNGQGTLTSPDGLEYVGQFKDGLMNGQGTATYPDGKKYIGKWKVGKRNGQGTETSPDGQKYVGQWKDDSPNGQGTAMYQDGSVYVGQFKNGNYNGQGTMKRLDGTYVGEWKDNKQDGQGTLTLPDGVQYVGEWEDNTMNGQGTLTNSDGSKESGQWKDGYFIGR